MSHNLSEKTREIFGKKPYLSLYFQRQPDPSVQFTLKPAKNPEEWFLDLNGRALSSTVAPLTQALRSLQAQKISATDLVAVIGLGNPHLIYEVHKNLEPGQILLLIDEHPELIFSLWDGILEPVMDVPGRHLFLGHSALNLLWNYMESLPVERVSGIRIFRNAASTSLNEMYYGELEVKIRKILSSKMSDLLTKFEFERIWVRNTFVNTANFPDSKNPRTRVELLKEKFSNTPAMLVSAGPSLRSQCEWISKVRDKVFLFSCDTSLKALLKFGIVPDGVITLDAQTHSFFHFMGAESSNVPLFADLVSSPPILRSQKFSKVVHSLTAKYVVDASGELKREVTAGSKTAEKILGTIGDIQSGGSVATTAFDLLRNLGCKPIFLVGQDLAYSGREIHSTGTHHNEKWLTLLNRTQSLERINEMIIRKRDTRLVPSAGGGEVLTDYVLDLYRHWFEESFQTLDFPVYNVNVRGAKIENCENVSIEKADSILSQFSDHGYYWKKFLPWNKERDPEVSSQTAETFRKELLEKIQNVLETFSNPLIREETYESVLSEFKKKIEGWEDLSYLVRKTEIYILRHRDTLDETRKKNLFLGAVLKEFTGLKRKLFSGIESKIL
ncbi:motility associated factor glycosyltransferase family protein [Leptospira sp. 201903070]|uniref:Motility associated factor glycosyltransferase family protein n=1 Tax=Leptospira ainlahdjerensis TaxID=2810033 RepID=A0ABS2U6L6_9LEPT|nr:6-hydroxymethylpterin diphosphokinase MptE-like protein [Leptospira ainlahdjerensis]MBM9576012.1 motility associated factor glycosyltransferase family protein [Leptospira ainlahdjerensis]